MTPPASWSAAASPPHWPRSHGEWAVLPDFTRQMLYLDARTYLPDDILTKVDRATMAVGLEARVPLLDHRVVALAWRLPTDLKIRDGVGKHILRQALYRRVPRAIFERPKRGFEVPLHEWLRGPLRDWAEDLLAPARLREEGFFAPAPIEAMWREHLSGRRNWHHHLWGRADVRRLARRAKGVASPTRYAAPSGHSALTRVTHLPGPCTIEGEGGP